MYGSDKIAVVSAENFSRFLKIEVEKWGSPERVVSMSSPAIYKLWSNFDQPVYRLWPESPYIRIFPEVHGYGNETAAAASEKELIELLHKGEIIRSFWSGYRPDHFKHFHIRYGRMEVILKIQFYDW